MALLFAASACRDPDSDRPWLPDERREFFARTEDAIRSDPGDFFVSVPVGVERERFALGATESLIIGQKVSIRAPAGSTASLPAACVSSLGALAVGMGTSLGSVYALGDAPALSRGVRIDGYLKSRLPVGNPVPGIRLGKVEGVAPYVEQFLLLPRLGAPLQPDAPSSPASHAAAELATTVPPGAYDTLTAEPGSTLRLESGSYSMGALLVLRDGTLEIDNSSGPVYVWVKRRLVLQGDINESVFEPTVFFGYAGSDPPQLQTDFRGTLLAPRATLKIPAAPYPHVGAFFARSIEVENGAAIEHQGFSRFATSYVKATDVCERCTGQAHVKARVCCNIANLWMSAHPTTGGCWSSYSDAAAGPARTSRWDAETERRADVEAWLTHCLHEARMGYGECVVRHRHRPDACARLRYPDAAEVTCSW